MIIIRNEYNGKKSEHFKRPRFRVFVYTFTERTYFIVEPVKSRVLKINIGTREIVPRQPNECRIRHESKTKNSHVLIRFCFRTTCDRSKTRFVMIVAQNR